MFRTSIAVVSAAVFVLAGAGPASAAETYQDSVGDATGDAPDIVAVTIEDSGDMPVVGISVEFASEPPLGTDGETWTDVVFIGLVTDPEIGPDGRPESRVALVDPDADYTIGAHGVSLPQYLEAGGHLVVSGGDLYWFVVDVAVEGPTVTWNLDRKLIGDPDVLAFGVIAGVERDDATEEEYDVFPDEGEPLALYTFTAPSR
jgi:hypothetical protein